MRRGTIIVIVFALVAAVIVGVSFFLQSQPPVEFTIAVNPLAEDWARAAINRFNDSQPVVNATQRIQFNLTVLDDVSVWQGSTTFTPEAHPAAWLPTSRTSVDYSDRYSVMTPSLARTPLVWGGYESRVTVATNSASSQFDWDTVQNAAAVESWASLDGGQANWRFVNLAFARPDLTMSGLGALFSAAGSFHDNGDIAGNATRDPGFRDWLAPVISSVNFQTLGNDPAAAVARGPATAAMALLPENLWLLNLRGLTDEAGDSFVFSYPAYQYMLDFPLARWSNANQITEIEQLAVTALADWLVAPEQQARLLAFGLRPAASEPDTSATLFTAAEPYGIQLEPDWGTLISPPLRSEAAGLIQWFTQQR
jgi:hypothetical protein